MYYFHIFQSKTDTVSEVCKKTPRIVKIIIISGVPSFTAIPFCFESLNTNSEHNISIASFLASTQTLLTLQQHNSCGEGMEGEGEREGGKGGRGRGKGKGARGGKGRGEGGKYPPPPPPPPPHYE